ncbi:hypothetical protein U1Q18_003396 [Sarracenia purpurea var. burkii]
MEKKFTTQMMLFLTDALSLIIEDEPQSTIAMDLVISQKEGKVEDLKSGSDPVDDGGSSFNGVEIETKQTDVKIKIRRAVPEALKSGPEESSIEDEDKAEGEDGGSSDVSGESIFSGDFETAEDPTKGDGIRGNRKGDCKGDQSRKLKQGSSDGQGFAQPHLKFSLVLDEEDCSPLSRSCCLQVGEDEFLLTRPMRVEVYLSRDKLYFGERSRLDFRVLVFFVTERSRLDLEKMKLIHAPCLARGLVLGFTAFRV